VVVLKTTGMNPILPYKDQASGKKEQVARMFDNISARYDFLNHFLSLGIDRLWRKRAVSLLRPLGPKRILDVATGTGDFAIAALALGPEQVTGIDISEGMLEIGREKLRRRKLDARIRLESGDSESLPFADNIFDAVIVAFGVRNFENLQRGLDHMHRVLRSGGEVVILEFSRPRGFPFRQIYRFYFHYILPIIGRVISKDQAAYRYLPESVQAFPEGRDFLNLLGQAGFKHTECIPLTFGICSIYRGKKS
jgi:demethylmenaquinone methyltransferase / 2-methoxy-6-polyprenyl-1,4-benzoquinol methylase